MISEDHFERQRKFIFYPGDVLGHWYVARQGNTLFRIFPVEGQFQVEDTRAALVGGDLVISQFPSIDAAAGYVVGCLVVEA